MTDQQKRLHLWHRLQHTIRIESILICPFCTDAYVLRYAQGHRGRTAQALPAGSNMPETQTSGTGSNAAQGLEQRLY